MNTIIKAGVIASAALFVTYGVAMADSGTSTTKLGGTLTMTHGMLRTSALDGATIYNDSGKDVGTLKKILINDSGSPSTAVATSDGKMISFPLSNLKFQKSDPSSTAKNPDYSVVYPGATEDMLKAMPKFEYEPDNN
jgi:hypothetical protein